MCTGVYIYICILTYYSKQVNTVFGVVWLRTKQEKFGSKIISEEDLMDILEV